MSWTFRITMLAIALALVAGAVVVLRPQPVDVEVAKVVLAPLEEKVAEDGRARVHERYTISAPVTGTLARIDLEEGDFVDPGEVLARLLPLASPLRDPESRNAAEQRVASTIDAFEQAKASVARAQALNEKAASDLARDETLAKQGALTVAQLEEARVERHAREAELAAAGFAAKVAEHEIAQARAALARFMPGAARSEQFEITSPVHGQVLHILRQSEGVVTAGMPLLEVGDRQALELVADVLSQDAIEIRPGMLARIVHWGGGTPLGARVRRVEPAAFSKTSALGVDEQRVNVVLDLDGPPQAWEALGDGFAVEIEITVWSKPDAIQVPTSALFREGSAWALFVIEGGRARMRQVEPGHRGPLETEILKGLEPGETVVIHPGAAVRDGTRVALR
jgi:HlyD family secretion protein